MVDQSPNTVVTTGSDRLQRERDFWDHTIPTLEEALSEFHAGPDPNTALMLDAIGPVRGKLILDFACGAGVTTAWLTSRGAQVVGIDLSPKSIQRAQEVAGTLGLEASFVVGDAASLDESASRFDGIVGRRALHHVDCFAVATVLAALAKPGSTSAFVETMSSNPVLRFARDRLVGRFGIPRVGTLDEHPLGESELDVLGRAFGALRSTSSSLPRTVCSSKVPTRGIATIPTILSRASRSTGSKFLGSTKADVLHWLTQGASTVVTAKQSTW